MSIEIIKPASEKDWLELRKKDITSTEVGALFGISKYISLYELWHRKRQGLGGDFEPHERMVWGNRLQDSIAHGVAEDQGWKVRRMDEYIRDNDRRMGASFDFSIEAVKDGEPCTPETDSKYGLLEIKNVDALIYRDQWTINDDDTVEAPPHIEIQVQHQLAVSGRAFAYIAALIGGNRVVLIKRMPDPEIIAAIKQKVAAFWESIEKNQEPVPDFTRDAKFIAKLYGYAEPGKVYYAEADMAFEALALKHKELGEMAKRIDEEREGLKAQMLLKIGDAEKVQGNGYSISAGIIGECEIAYTRKAYRNFKPNWPRTKK